jgi:hypothetical protein
MHVTPCVMLHHDTLTVSKGFPYAASPARGFPYGTIREFLVDTQMRNTCYTMRRAKKNEIK